ncbi:MAG: acetate/propionate family kinase [Propionibacteriaceae bacterium]|jgi:acetate kinase|nr:acetate/propionate family kinase [Propionibacteriaceae bacterium]
MTGPILVLKVAVSTLKYYVFDVENKDPLAQGRVRGIGQPGVGEIWHETGDQTTHTPEQTIPDIEAALTAALQLIESQGIPVSTLQAVTHRVIHGADRYSKAAFIDEDVIQVIEELTPLAPAHNPAAAEGIRAVEKCLPGVPQVAVFDTAFFSKLPAAVARYALPKELSDRLHLRKFGFHGPTHRYVAERVSLLTGRLDLKQIIVYLGRWSSISAVASGKPIEVSTGFTPFEGLPMRTASGSIDPGIHRYVMEHTGMSIAEFDELLREGSGMLGLTGLPTMAEVWDAADAGDEQAQLAIGICVHRIVSYIAAFHVVLGGAQAISFTGTAGEQDHRLRKAICDRLACLGVELDEGINEKTHSTARSRIVSTAHSAIPVMVIQQREAFAIAHETAILLGWKHPVEEVVVEDE